MPIGYSSSTTSIYKASVTAVAALEYSLWRAVGVPVQPAIPAAARTCNGTTEGGFKPPKAGNPNTYLSALSVRGSNSGAPLILGDRLKDIGGLSGTVTTAQTVGLNLADLPAARVGASDYKEIEWYLEWYTATGSTAATATVNVTYSDGSTGNLTGIALSATRPASFIQRLSPSIPLAQAGLGIRAVNTVTLSASTGTAGNFGVTASRYITDIQVGVANYLFRNDYPPSAMPDIHPDACLWLTTMPTTTSTGIFTAQATFIHGA